MAAPIAAARSARSVIRRGNYVATRPVGDVSGSRTMRQARQVDMRALEVLPASVRRMLNELTIALSAEKTLAYYNSIARQARERGGSPFDAEVWTLRKLAQTEAVDLDAFAARHQRAHGYPLPHTAAMVSVLRYGSVEPRRRSCTPGWVRLKHDVQVVTE